MEWPSYHLWVSASEPLRQRSMLAIAQLSSLLGGPRFEPHVTLTSDLEASERELVRSTENLAKQLSAFDLELVSIAFGDQHFRCIYATARLTAALAHARESARAAFGLASAPFEPHLSLAYGTHTLTRKLAAVTALDPQQLLGTHRVDTLSLIRAESADPADWHEVCAARMSP